jgi:hypothetical protein
MRCEGSRATSGFRLQIVSGAFAALLLNLSSANAETCGRAGLNVSGVRPESSDVCKAIDEVIGYFDKGGIRIDLQLTIRFQRSVHVEAINLVDGSSRPYSVSGVYRADRKEIQMVASDSPWGSKRRPWTLAWDADIAASILRHEIVHAVINQLLGSKREKLPRAWHEALAYGVQIDLMSEDLRGRVLARYPDQEALSSTLHVNDLVYGIDPDGFAVAAYKLYVREGRLEFLKKAVALQFEMIDLDQFLF